MIDTLFENWIALKALIVVWLTYGFGFAAGIILAVLIAIKEDILDWWEDRWRKKD